MDGVAEIKHESAEVLEILVPRITAVNPLSRYNCFHSFFFPYVFFFLLKEEQIELRYLEFLSELHIRSKIRRIDI